MKRTLLFVTLFCAWSAQAQEFTYRFDWHGYSNFFHASFTVSQQDFSSQFNGPLFWGTITCTNPVGQVFNTGSDYAYATGTYIPWNLGVQLVDYRQDSEIFFVGGTVAGNPYRTAGWIQDYSISGNGPAWLEQGYWSVTQQVPEPSVASLCVLGVILAPPVCNLTSYGDKYVAAWFIRGPHGQRRR